MAIIPQKNFFSWEEIEDLGDLDRLRLVLENLPDGELMRILENERGKGRDDYPVRPLWNSILAGVVFQHESVASLDRELLRNAQLRQICGFDVLKGAEAVPPEYVYSRFLKSLMNRQEEIDLIFEKLVDKLREVLPEFGKTLAIDSKAIKTHAKKRTNNETTLKQDGRRDLDADVGKKQYRGKKKDGTLWEKVKSWFGYKIHLIVDAEYELPVAYKVTKASPNDSPVAHEMIDTLEKDRGEILSTCEIFSGDRGYDDTKLIERLWDDHEIKSVIDIRNMWKDGEDTHLIEHQDNVVYDYRGNVSCYCPETTEQRDMAFGGFEKDRFSLKYRCPAKQYGLKCAGENECPVQGSIRIPLDEERRVFTPLARSSYKWKSEYNKRTSVERVNSRLDVSFGFEHHFIRGLKKMKLRCGLALCVMLAMAIGRIREGEKDKMRSLVTAVG